MMEEKEIEKPRERNNEKYTLLSLGFISTLFSAIFAISHIAEWQQVADVAKYIEGDTGLNFYESTIAFWSILFVLLFVAGLITLLLKHKLGILMCFGITVFAVLFMFMLSPVGK